MKESVNSVFQRNESTCICNFYNISVNFGSRSISFIYCIPWIWSCLFKSKRNTSCLNIISKNNSFNFLTERNHITRLIDFLCPREFTDMNKTFNSFFKFNKSTKFCKFCYFSFYNIIYMIFFFKMNPRIFCKVFQRKINSLFSWIKTNYF